MPIGVVSTYHYDEKVFHSYMFPKWGLQLGPRKILSREYLSKHRKMLSLDPIACVSSLILIKKKLILQPGMS